MKATPFMRRTDLHPTWCGKGHVCSIDRPGGEHRSHPTTVDTGTTRLVTTRVRTQTGRDRLEVRIVIDLPIDADHAKAMVHRFMVRLHHLLNTARTGDDR